MTLSEFVNTYLGKKVDFDGFYGGQCVDLYRQYVKDVLIFPQSPGVGGAAEIWDSADPKYYDFIQNDPYAIPKPGDIVIWNRRVGGGFGHVAIFLEGDVNKFTSLDQNWPTLSKVTKTEHTYSSVIGWLRPKISSIGNDMPNYKGLDLNNEESMKVAVDVWADVRDGKYVRLDEHNRIVSELKSDIDKEKSIARETKKSLESFKETLAGKLTTIVDTAEIIGAVERLLSRETELQREVTKVEKAYALLESEKAEEIKSLKAELDALALELIDSREKYEKQIGNLKQRVEQLEGNSEANKSQKAVFEALEGLITTITNLLRRDK